MTSRTNTMRALSRFGSHAAVAALALTVALGGPALAQDAALGDEPALSAYVLERFGTPPAIPAGEPALELQKAVAKAFAQTSQRLGWGPDQAAALDAMVASKDPRYAWLITDLMRFSGGPRLGALLAGGAADLLGIGLPTRNPWGTITDHLIAWDIPAPPGYLAAKRGVFTSVVPDWAPLFAEGDIDWRHVSWGGVLIDDRPFGRTDEDCNCIPAADDPEVESAKAATWLDDDAIVFGVVVNGEARAYPRRIMEVREMVNDSLGGRDLGIPYCTLCGAAQAYFTDAVPAGVARPVLRTSGLLIRSNKVMYDVVTKSVFDTFLGHAVTGPLAELGVTLPQASVVTTRWGDWKAAHPGTTVLVEALALGRDFDFRNGRDADGPIFPVGDVDPRLPVHEDVLGVVTASGEAIAFQRSTAVAALTRGESVAQNGVSLRLEAGGLRAVDARGQDLGSHQAFWFAWSQFHPGTALWAG